MAEDKALGMISAVSSERCSSAARASKRTLGCRVRRQLPEIARIGASMATFPGIHLRLATGSSYLCGLQEQKERPEMARMEKIGGRATSGGHRRRPEHMPEPAAT